MATWIENLNTSFTSEYRLYNPFEFVFALEICVLHFTQIKTEQGHPRAHSPAGLWLVGIVNFKLLRALISIHSLSLPLWFSERLQLEKTKGRFSCCYNPASFPNISLMQRRWLRYDVIPHAADFPVFWLCVGTENCLQTQKATKAILLFCLQMFTVTWSVASIWLSINGDSPSKRRDCNPSMSD